MKVLDLFCGGGGASEGMKRAGADEIWGVDIGFQHHYPFWFIQADVFNLSLKFIRQFDFVWASPPCQAYSYAAARWRNSGKTWPDLIARTRGLLIDAAVPFCIENVPGAPIRKDLLLCGQMFELHVIRHRYFELFGFSCYQPVHRNHRGMVMRHFYVTVAGTGGNYPGHNFDKLRCLEGATQLETWRYAMGIDRMDKKCLREAVPPAYAEFIFGEFMRNNYWGMRSVNRQKFHEVMNQLGAYERRENEFKESSVPGRG